LRQIEISVMQYRESLEEQGIRNMDEIERKVASHRRHLQSEYGLSTSTDGANSRRSSGMIHPAFLTMAFMLHRHIYFVLLRVLHCNY
jgi:hypothetical protein